MQYEEALEYIHSLEKFGIKPGMERITALCRAFGDIQNTLRFIHVAGTNGKGSTSTMLANICRRTGYKTGLYISPYVIDFRERIQIDGQLVEKEMLAEVVSRIRPVAEQMRKEDESPTEFEIITAAAFLCFAKAGCDVVVLETGLGGRLDATNIIHTPLVNVITSVSYDHMAVLGDTLTQIAREKCGTIKENGVVVSYPLQSDEVRQVIAQTAAEKHNTLLVPDTAAIAFLQEDITGTDAVIDGLSVHVPMLGRHMVYNASAVVMAARALNDRGLCVSDADIQNGIADSVLPARMEIIHKEPLVLLDGGHNEDCANALRNAVMQHLSGRHIVGICGLMADKAYDRYLSVVAPLMDALVTVRPENPRALSAEALCSAAGAYCADCTAADSFQKAAELALQKAGTDGVVIACGSFYMAADLEKYLK